MVTRQPPRLDVLLRAQLTVTEPGDIAYQFCRRIMDNDFSTYGDWRIDSDGTLYLDFHDEDSDPLPETISPLPLPGASVAFGTDPATPITITAWDGVFPVYGPGRFTAWQVSYTGTLPDPGAAQDMTITLPLGAGTERVEDRIVWAGRRDFTAQDAINASVGGTFEITDVRFIVRADGVAWAVGDSFLDDQGVKRTVRGIAHLDRGRFLELLAREVS